VHHGTLRWGASRLQGWDDIASTSMTDQWDGSRLKTAVFDETFNNVQGTRGVEL